VSPRLKVRQSQWRTASRDRGFSFDDKPTVDSKDELTMATSRSHNLRRRSNCNLCACSLPPWATRSPGRGRACPTLSGSAAMYAQGTASRPPTAKGLSGIGVRPGSAGPAVRPCGSSSDAGSYHAANKVIRIATSRVAVEEPQGWKASLALGTPPNPRI
jgi:hypothetical protein